MREFTFDFGSKPKKYLFTDPGELTGERPLLRFVRTEEALSLTGQLIGKLMSYTSPFRPQEEDTYKITVAVELLRQTYGKPFTLVCPVADGGALLRGCKATVQAFDEEIRVVAAVADGQNADAAFQADSRFDVTLPQIEEAKALALEQEGVRLGDESGAALFAAANLAAEPANLGRMIIAVLTDGTIGEA